MIDTIPNERVALINEEINVIIFCPIIIIIIIIKLC